MRALLFLGFLAAAVACGDHAERRVTTAKANRPDSAIYAAILDSLRPGPRPVRVVRQYELLPDSEPEVAKVAGWAAAQRDHLDSALIVALARDQHVGSVAATLGDQPGVRWIELDSVRAESLRRNDNSRLIQLSRIAYSPDSTRALIYASMWCGGLCGNGSFYQFQRSSRRGWHLVGTVLRFIS